MVVITGNNRHDLHFPSCVSWKAELWYLIINNILEEQINISNKIWCLVKYCWRKNAQLFSMWVCLVLFSFEIQDGLLSPIQGGQIWRLKDAFNEIWETWGLEWAEQWSKWCQKCWGRFFFIFTLFLGRSFFYNSLMALLGFLLYIVVARNANEGTQLGEPSDTKEELYVPSSYSLIQRIGQPVPTCDGSTTCRIVNRGQVEKSCCRPIDVIQ